MKEPIYHPYANLFPMLSFARLHELSEDIKANGQLDPIIMHEGKILDGRNRWQACVMAEIEPRTVEFDGPDPLAYVISKNLVGRHLTESQRAMIAAKVATMRAGEFKGNQHCSPPIGENQLSRKDRQTAAAELQVGTSSLDRARKVQRDGVPELSEAVEKGEVTVNAASQVAKLPDAEQRAVVAGGAAAIKAKAKELRSPKADEPTPDEEMTTTTQRPRKRERVGKHVPDDARRLWTLARTHLDKILPNDISREATLREVIAYCETRLDQNK